MAPAVIDLDKAKLDPQSVFSTPQEVIASLRADRTLARVTDLAVQVHSIDPPHPWILRSVELVAQEVAPAFGWRPAPDHTQRFLAENVI